MTDENLVAGLADTAAVLLKTCEKCEVSGILGNVAAIPPDIRTAGSLFLAHPSLNLRAGIPPRFGVLRQ